MTGTPLRRSLQIVALAAFAASWFLPVIVDVAGWEAFKLAIDPTWPRPPLAQYLIQAASGLTNFVFVFVLACLVLGRGPGARTLRLMLIGALIFNLQWLGDAIRENEVGSLAIGYHAWLAAFALLTVAAHLRGLEPPAPANA
jgi:hypothetical protein